MKKYEAVAFGLLLTSFFLLGHLFIVSLETMERIANDVRTTREEVTKLRQFNEKYLKPAFVPVN